MACLGLKTLISSVVVRCSAPTARFFSAYVKDEEMKRFMEDPSDSTMTKSCPSLFPLVKSWETEKAMHLKFTMPGLGREDVEVSTAEISTSSEATILRICGESPYEATRAYDMSVLMRPHVYDCSKLELKMVNGLLKVVIPKAKVQLSGSNGSQ